MLEYIKVILLIVAVLLNYKNKNMVAIIAIIGFDILLPIPIDAGRAVWCMDCIIVDALAGFLILLVDTSITSALCMLCFSLVPIHLIYLQAGRAHFPEYGIIVPIIECAMLFFCIVGGATETHATHKLAAIIRKYFLWMLFDSRIKNGIHSNANKNI